MRIVLVDPGAYTAHYDGNLCHELAQRGHVVRLDTSRFLFEEVAPLGGYEVQHWFFESIGAQNALSRWNLTRQAAKAVTYPFELGRWVRSIRGKPPDVLHVQWSLVPPLDVLALRRVVSNGTRLVFTAHELPNRSKGPWGGAFASLCRLADAVVVHAQAPAHRLVDEFGVPVARVHHVPMGGPGRYAGVPMFQAEARERLGLPADGRLALFFGLVKEYKGLDVLLEALAIARRSTPELRLLVAGRPLQRWGSYDAQIERLGLRPAVELMTEFVPTELLNAVFGAADVVVAPYKRAAQSGVVLAAWQFGRPVVATRVGGLPELVDEGVTGFLARPDDPGDLARALVEAVSDRGRLDRMTTTVAVAAGSHAWPAIAERHEEIYVGVSASG